MERTVALTPEQRDAVLAKLRVPFEPSEVLWRVSATSRTKKKGRIVPYADKRSYTDRLNAVCTPAGWSQTLAVTTVSPIQRKTKAGIIQTGKVIVSCTVTILGIGTRESSGEGWADDENAMTRAEAQAFKRACSEFGLGRYFYDFGELWVNLNEYGDPLRIPPLPSWAVPPKTSSAAAHAKSVSPGQAAPQPPSNRGQRKPPQGTPATPPPQNRNAAAAPQNTPANQTARTQAATAPQMKASQSAANQPIILPAEIADPKLKARIAGYSQLLGAALYGNIVHGTAAALKSGVITGDLATRLLDFMSRAARGIEEIKKLAEQLPSEETFRQILDAHNVSSLAEIPTLHTVPALIAGLQAAVAGAQGSVA